MAPISRHAPHRRNDQAHRQDHRQDHAHDHAHGQASGAGGDLAQGGCAHAHARATDAPAALEAAEASCRERGLRLTPVRRQVLEALHATHRPLSAYEIIERVGPQDGRMLAPISIYRALDFLLEAGFAHRLESRNAFIACPAHHAPGEVVVFMICEHCGGVDEAVSDDLRAALSRLADENGFQPATQFIELAGACAHCKD
ncbi:MAG: transcriptional repressor [Alsobacter sp.]